jgi:chromosome segregation ATPase
MRLLPSRPTSLSRIQRRITRLADRARSLGERETETRRELGECRRRAGEAGRSARRAERSVPKLERRLERLAAQRREVVLEEFGEIMRTLAERSRRTREELDRALAPLVGIAVEWGQIEKTFELLDEAAGSPEIAAFVGECRGTLSVPPFPVREEEGYVVPFPSDAFVF